MSSGIRRLQGGDAIAEPDLTPARAESPSLPAEIRGEAGYRTQTRIFLTVVPARTSAESRIQNGPVSHCAIRSTLRQSCLPAHIPGTQRLSVGCGMPAAAPGHERRVRARPASSLPAAVIMKLRLYLLCRIYPRYEAGGVAARAATPRSLWRDESREESGCFRGRRLAACGIGSPRPNGT
jgi:hypothetical protein